MITLKSLLLGESTLTPTTQLPIGTLVSVNGKIGKVIKNEMVRSHHGERISLHTIQYYIQPDYKGQNGIHYKKYNKTGSPNYSFIKPIPKDRIEYYEKLIKYTK